jgi:hypothetical protein
MRITLCCAAMAALAALGWSAADTTPAKKATAPGKTVTKAAASAQKKAPARKGATTSAASAAKKKAAPSKAGVSKRATATRTTATHPAATKAGSKTTTVARRGKKGPPAKRATWRNRQLAPTPQRYKEIQEALAAKGYLKPEDANGTWTQASSDALKKFQAGQNLDSTGKINSLSLIALGLGPKRETAAPHPPAESPPAPSR